MTITSSEIKKNFKNAGLNVRVKKLNNGQRFRICTTSGEDFDFRFMKIVNKLGFTDGRGEVGGNINQSHEFFWFCTWCC